MTEETMLKEMFLELGQADLKAIGRSRGFDPQTIASPQLMQHVFLSEQAWRRRWHRSQKRSPSACTF